MILSLAVAFFMATIPRFSEWLTGFVKALFITPRYVWVKEGSIPEILTGRPVKSKTQDKNISSSISKKKLDIDSLPIVEMFATRAVSNPDYSFSSDLDIDVFDKNVSDSKFDQVMQNIYAREMTSTTSRSKVTSVEQEKTAQNKKRPLPTSSKELVNEIKLLKLELSKIKKDDNYKEKEELILNRISELFRELKILSGKYNSMDERTIQKQRSLQPQEDGKEIYGIVVSKSNIPIANAKVIFVNQSNQKIQALTNQTGKFNTEVRLPNGEYSVYIEAPPMRFHTYKIVVGDQKLPGYKFREK
jgi:hypothetical protein